MAPEQAAGDPDLDHRADIYAVGVMAYEMFEGHVPFSGTPQAVMGAHVATPPPPMTARADLPASIRRIVMTCLEKDPGRRYASADALLADLDAVATPAGGLASIQRRRRKAALWLGAVALIAVALWFGTARQRAVRWARNDALPRIKAYSDLAQYDSAGYLANQVRAVLPTDSAQQFLWLQFSRKAVLHSEPEGAKVYRATFGDTTHWTLLGTTPTDSIYLPIGYGHLRVERPGFRTVSGLIASGSRRFMLDSLGAPNAEMAHLPGGSMDVFLVGLDAIPPITLGDFFLDKHEVTNKEYKAFVDAGGYDKREWWPATITDGGKPLAWEAAVARFRAKTGRTGPATWEAGDFPKGQGDFPVGGVSWYEAVAYAKYAGKSLPTIFHWARAASIGAARFMVTGSNFESNGPVAGSTWRGMSPFGVFDMAGNVREWCENGSLGDERYILGGGWSESPYGFTDGYAQPAMDRSAINGIRLARYPHDDSALAQARLPQHRQFRDYTRETPVSDAAFESMRHVFDYDRRALNAKVESRDTTEEDWDLERVSFDAAYGKERVMAILFLPKHRPGPFQSVVYFPGSGALRIPSSVERRDQVASFVVKTGRAFILPIMKSTYERRDSMATDIPDSSVFWRDHVVMWVQDMRRTLDYLATRPDMDTSRIAYFGFSWGSTMAPMSLATDPRYKAAVLYVAGLTMGRSRPEADPFNYLSRVKLPVLMMNGRYDFFYPVDVAQRPFFNGLGTPKDRKEWHVYDGGHDVPRTDLITQTLRWLDKYLGPPR